MSRKLILASTIAMVMAGTDASALGLGGLRTQSALNQPFQGHIELRDIRADEIDSVSAAIASQDAFGKAGIERYYYLTRLTFTPEVTQQGKAVIRVSSKDPIREPYMDFLVSVVWPTGRLVKEYTVLLDPPSLSGQSAPAVRSASAESVASGSRTAAAQAAGVGRSNAYIPAPGDGFPIYAGPVANGMGLWALARDKAPAGATAAQTAMAFYRNNQNAFIRGDINRLIAGKTLVIPSSAELFALDAGAAQREYLAGLRGRAQYREPITDVAATQASRLQLSGASETPRGDAVQAPAPAAQRDLMLALETSESTRQETVELRDRVKELESQLEDIQKLLQLRNAELARMQGVGPVPGSLAEQPLIALETTEDAQSVEPPAQPGSASESVSMPDEQPADTDRSADLAESGDPIESENVVESLDAALAEAEAEAEAEADVTPALIPVPVPTPVAIETETVGEVAAVPPEEPAQAIADGTPDSSETNSTWHSLLLPLAGLAGVTALGIMVFSWMAMRRRREEEEALEDYEAGSDDDLYDTLDVATEPRSSLLTEDGSTVVAATSKAGDQPLSEPPSVHTREADGESGLTMMSSLSNFDAETDEADILSEADIYIAYGRHSEAQDLLRSELQRFPERLDVRFKLAESFAAAKDLDALNGVMQEIQSAGGAALEPMLWTKLQSQREQLRMGGTPASGAAAPAAASLEGLEGTRDRDSLDLGSEDSFSLDISDVQRKSTQSQGVDSASGLDLGKGDPLLEGDLEDTGFDRDSFGDAMTVAVHHGLPDPEELRRDEDGEIEMTLEEHKVEDIDDLDSIFDTNVIDEPTLARNEITGARPTDVDVSDAIASGILDSSETGLSPDQESVPSDLLSSQWQIDSGIWDETATKLDLARAYIEMDDKDAAREILEEVVAEGRDEQQTEARALLDNLA